MAVTVWVCKICGEAYINDDKPHRCPFCGAYEKYFVDSKEYDSNSDWELDGQKLFKILAKVEAEHAAVWKKILKLDKIKWEPQETCEADYNADLKDSHAREERAIKFYGESAATAENPRVKEIFKAFVEVETDHLFLSELRLK